MYAVLTAIRERLDADPKAAPSLIKFLVRAAAVGGFAYVLVKLLSSFSQQDTKAKKESS